MTMNRELLLFAEAESESTAATAATAAATAAGGDVAPGMARPVLRRSQREQTVPPRPKPLVPALLLVLGLIVTGFGGFNFATVTGKFARGEYFGLGNVHAFTIMGMVLITIMGLGLLIDSAIRWRRTRHEARAWEQTVCTPGQIDETVLRLVQQVRNQQQLQDASTPTRRALLAVLNEQGIVGKRLRAFLVYRTMQELEAAPSPTTPAAIANTTAPTPTMPEQSEPRVDSGYGKSLPWLWYALGVIAIASIFFVGFVFDISAVIGTIVAISLGIVALMVAHLAYESLSGHKNLPHQRRRAQRQRQQQQQQ